jgi:hypothetical protein
MELELAVRRRVTAAMVKKYRKAGKVEKSQILDHLCEVTGWHRDHARKALRAAMTAGSGPPQARRSREPVWTYGPEVIEALRKVWAVLDGPTGKRLAPILPDLVASLRAHGELDITDEVAAGLCAMSAATIDRRLAADRAELATSRGRTLTKPGGLLKSQIPMRTWADWDEQIPGFIEVDLVGHDGGDLNGEFCFTLTGTDIATGWTETRTVRNKAASGSSARWWRSRPTSRSRCWASTRTTAASSSISTCCDGASTTRSRSPDPGRTTRTTARTWNRRTGPWCGAPPATGATRPPAKWRC